MANILENSMDYLAQFDPEIASQMQSEYQRQHRGEWEAGEEHCK